MDGAVLATLQAIQQQLASLSTASQEQASALKRLAAGQESLAADVAILKQFQNSLGVLGDAPTPPRPAQGTGSGGTEAAAAPVAPPACPPRALPMAEAAAAGPAADEDGELPSAPDAGCELFPGSPPAAALERLRSMQRDADAAAGPPASCSPGSRRRRQAPSVVRPGRRLVAQSIAVPAAPAAAQGPAPAAAAAASQQASADGGHTFPDGWVLPPNRKGRNENFAVAALPAVAPGMCWQACVAFASWRKRPTCLPGCIKPCSMVHAGHAAEFTAASWCHSHGVCKCVRCGVSCTCRLSQPPMLHSSRSL